MNRQGLAQGVIDALPEPAFLLTRSGGIIGANRAAHGLLADARQHGSNDGPHGAPRNGAHAGPHDGTRDGDIAPAAAAGAPAAPSSAAGGVSTAPEGPLADRVLTPRDQLEAYLARCSATTAPLPGALVFRTPDGSSRFRVHCSRLSGRTDEVLLLLRCADPRGDRFSILAERVRQLDAELRQRVREKAVLREALDENRNLMRELQHRVKNNIQMMISLLSMSAANGGSADVRTFVNAAKDRFRALATTQDLIYEAQSASVIPSRELFVRLARALAESTDGAVDVRPDVEDFPLPQESAHCLALIVNELVTNSIKHGVNGGTGTVRITLVRDDGQLRLTVHDDGPGYPQFDALPRSSGLTLVRGLCRQIGAGLELGNDGGARSVVTFAETRPSGGDPRRDPGGDPGSGAGSGSGGVSGGRREQAAGAPAST